MSQAKVALRNHRRKAVPVLGAAGLSLSLAGGAPAAIGVTTEDMPKCSVAMNQQQTLREDEITDVTLSTFHVFDRESTPRLRARIAGGAGCGACGSGLYTNQPAYNGPVSQPAYNGPVSAPLPRATKSTHPIVHTVKRPLVPKDQDQRASRAAQPEAGALRHNQNANRQAQPEVDGLTVNQSAGQQAQPQVARPVTNSAN
jgi:hypothetical protein